MIGTMLLDEVSAAQAALRDARDLARLREFRARMALPKVTDLQAKASMIYGVPVEDIRAKTRMFAPSRARHWVFYHAVMQGRTSTPDIGRRTGARDHSTVIAGAIAHAIRHRLEMPGDRDPGDQYPHLYEGPEPTLDRPFNSSEARRYRKQQGGTHATIT